MKKNEHLLDSLLELQILDRVPRMGYTLRGIPNEESVAEHTLHVAFLIWALAPRIEGLDTARALELALVHDLAEVRTGDLPKVASGYYAEGAKQEAEQNVLLDLLGPLAARGAPLLREYQAAETPEARLVKACDKLQLMIKVYRYELWGAKGLEEFWHNSKNFVSHGFEPVAELFEELRRRRLEEGPAEEGPQGDA